jgi:hypothetical protein
MRLAPFDGVVVLGWVLAIFFGLGALGALVALDLSGLVISGLLTWLGVTLIRRGRARSRATAVQLVAPGAPTSAPTVPVGGRAAAPEFGRFKLVPADDGYVKEAGDQRLRGRGFHIHTLNDGIGVAWRELGLWENGVLVATIAGARYRPRMLQSPVTAPGKPLRLVRDPRNVHDPNAVQVHAVSQASDTLVGYVPRGDAPAVAAALDQGHGLHACVLWEWIGEDDKRDSLVMVIARPGLVQGV